MRPLSLEISAFGPYAGKEFIELEKLGKSGLYLITGDTGAGKTTGFQQVLFNMLNQYHPELLEDVWFVHTDENKAKAELEKLTNKLKTLEEENKILNEKYKEANEKKDAATEKRDEYGKKKTDLEVKANNLSAAIDKAGDLAQKYKAELDNLYAKQTETQGKIDGFSAKIAAEEQRKDTIEETKDAIIENADGKKASVSNLWGLL